MHTTQLKWLLWKAVFTDSRIVRRSNLVEGIDNNYINECLFHPKKEPLCPIFKLGDVVKLSGFSFEKLAQEVSFQQSISVLIDKDSASVSCDDAGSCFVKSQLQMYCLIMDFYIFCLLDREGLLALSSTGHVTLTLM